MEREEYLKLCQKCATIEKRIGGVINNMPKELIVSCLGMNYYPVKYELSFDNNGNPQHTAILHDLYANSVTYVDLRKVVKTYE
jgi:hypothetical protein